MAIINPRSSGLKWFKRILMTGAILGNLLMCYVHYEQNNILEKHARRIHVVVPTPYYVSTN